MSMTDDDKALVELLRDWGDTIDPGVVTCNRKTIEIAADRIEQLEAALHLIIKNEDQDTGYGNSSAKIARAALRNTK